MKGNYFKTPIKAQPEATHTKDVELRLECLKLAVQANCVDPCDCGKRILRLDNQNT
jgi:hypothetical protein